MGNSRTATDVDTDSVEGTDTTAEDESSYLDERDEQTVHIPVRAGPR